MAASDYVPIFFKNRLHLAGRPQMSTRPKLMTADWMHRHRNHEHNIGWRAAGAADYAFRLRSSSCGGQVG